MKKKFGLTIRRYMAEILPIRRKTFSSQPLNNVIFYRMFIITFNNFWRILFNESKPQRFSLKIYFQILARYMILAVFDNILNYMYIVQAGCIVSDTLF